MGKTEKKNGKKIMKIKGPKYQKSNYENIFRADFKKIVKQKGNQDDLKCKKTLSPLNLFKTS